MTESQLRLARKKKKKEGMKVVYKDPGVAHKMEEEL